MSESRVQTSSPATSVSSSAEVRGDALKSQGQYAEAIAVYVEEARRAPTGALCLKLARSYEHIGDFPAAGRWALAVVDAGDGFTIWQAAWGLYHRCASKGAMPAGRSVKLAILSSYTTTQFRPMLLLAAHRVGIQLEMYECAYGQYQQEILDTASGLYRFAPDVVLLAVHEQDLRLPSFSPAPERDIEAEAARWLRLWEALLNGLKTRIVHHGFVVPSDVPEGHLAARLPGCRYGMVQAVNRRLGGLAADNVSIVDCDRLASWFGKQRWFDPRYWNLSKQAVALDALPLLARHTVAVLNASLGLSRKCLVLDLDNTLWGGVIAEDGLAGIRLGSGVDGEAYVAFQEYILKLKSKGVILAVCSKNNRADALLPFEKHPDMRIKLDDIALFVANWEPKPDNVKRMAAELNIGLDSLVFVDDNPVEREAIRQFVPQVDVIPLPEDPSYYVRALSQYLLFETNSLTSEDSQRTEQYRARAQYAELEKQATSLDDFYVSLQMEAVITPFSELDLPRIAQLIGKTNQFNLTTRRYGMAQLEAFVKDPNYVHLALRLRDRFADHGLVAVLIARRDGDVLDIDTWLMSCRVIGRTVEASMLESLCRYAQRLRCRSLQGTYIPTEKNALAAGVYEKYGFSLAHNDGGRTTWLYNLEGKGAVVNSFIRTEEK